MQESSYILLGLGILLIVAEIFVPGFVLFPIGVGLLTSIVWTFFFTEPSVLILLSVLHAVACFFLVQRYFRNRPTPHHRSNVESMIGQRVLVTEAIEPKVGGYVKLYGDSWKALSSTDEPIAVGEELVIIRLDGNKVIVSRV